MPSLQGKFPLWILISLKENILCDKDKALGFKLFMAVTEGREGKGDPKRGRARSEDPP